VHKWSEERILGDELRIARETVGFSQKDLSTKIFLSRCAISAIENGRREIKRAELRLWAESTGKTIDNIYAIVEWRLKRS
jgi:transcriptional regulator with XRE-family HTH domain